MPVGGLMRDEHIFCVSAWREQHLRSGLSFFVINLPVWDNIPCAHAPPALCAPPPTPNRVSFFLQLYLCTYIDTHIHTCQVAKSDNWIRARNLIKRSSIPLWRWWRDSHTSPWRPNVSWPINNYQEECFIYRIGNYYVKYYYNMGGRTEHAHGG